MKIEGIKVISDEISLDDYHRFEVLGKTFKGSSLLVKLNFNEEDEKFFIEDVLFEGKPLPSNTSHHLYQRELNDDDIFLTIHITFNT